MTHSDRTSAHRAVRLSRLALASANVALEEALHSPNPDDFYPALAHSCWWTVVVDDAFERLHASFAPEDKAAYRSRRNVDQYGRVVRGLRYVRNLVGHYSIVATRTHGGLTMPFTVPALITSILIVWLPEQDLPPSPDEFPNPKLREAYADEIAGHSVLDTFHCAGWWFAQEASDYQRRTGTFI